MRIQSNFMKAVPGMTEKQTVLLPLVVIFSTKLFRAGVCPKKYLIYIYEVSEFFSFDFLEIWME